MDGGCLLPRSQCWQSKLMEVSFSKMISNGGFSSFIWVSCCYAGQRKYFLSSPIRELLESCSYQSLTLIRGRVRLICLQQPCILSPLKVRGSVISFSFFFSNSEFIIGWRQDDALRWFSVTRQTMLFLWCFKTQRRFSCLPCQLLCF